MVTQMQAFGQNVVSLWAGWTQKPFRGLNKYRRIRFTREDVELLKGLSVVETAGGEMGVGSREVRYRDKETAIRISGVDPVWAELRNVRAQSGGRDINEMDLQEKRRVAVIGENVKEELFGTETAIGKTISIENSPYIVVGIVTPKDTGKFHRERSSDKIFIPLTTCMTMNNNMYIDSIVYRPVDIKQNKKILSTVISFLARQKSFDPDDVSAVHVWDMTDSDEFIGEFTFGLQVFMAIIGVFTLTVAAIGVANIMNVIVEERTKEIGIKMALGITRRAVMFQFVFESFMFTFVGGFVGFLISKGLCAALRQVEMEGFGKPYVTISVALTSIFVLGAAAFLAGIFPARRASLLNPVEALRWQ